MLLVYHSDDHHLIAAKIEQLNQATMKLAETKTAWLKRNQNLMPGLTWDHTEDIALALARKIPRARSHPHPLHRSAQWITELEDFKDDPKDSTEGKLEAIQMAWLEEYQESQE